MKTIIAGKSKISKLLGKQLPTNTVYRAVKYLLTAECEDGLLLHNVITGQLVLLEKNEADIFRNLPSSYESAMRELVENHYLVPLDYAEQNTVKQLRSLMKKVFTPEGINGYTILTTTNCNARCFYCYQSDYPHINMSSETASKLVDYMIRHKSDNTIHISWFGGEPLVGMARIDQICSRLNREGIKYTSAMVSNGYLFTKDIVEKAVMEWNLKSIQISIDGTEEIYNRTKAYVSCSENPYKRVMTNLKLLIDRGVFVSVRLNLDQHNIQDLKNLVNELHDTIGAHKNFEVYAHVLFENAGYEPIMRNSKVERTLYEYQNELNMYLEEVNLSKQRAYLPYLRYHGCMADNPASTVVYPDGRLFKCEHTTPGDEYGHLETGISNIHALEKFQQITEFDRCRECPLYPHCISLKECHGVGSHNEYTCDYDLSSRTRSVLGAYAVYKSKKSNKT